MITIRLDIRQDSEFATGYGYPKTAFKQKPDTDPDIRNAFIDIRGFRLLEKVAQSFILYLESSEAAFQAWSHDDSKSYLCCNLSAVVYVVPCPTE